jgi:DNA-binding XRE family transcriptional regulator
MKNTPLQQNRLEEFRRRMRFSTDYVAHLLEHRRTATYREYERGSRLPALVNAFRLGIIMRVPVEFLFGELYDSLRNQIRAEEERLAQPSQQTLF